MHVNELPVVKYPRREQYFFGSLPKVMIRSLIALFRVDFELMGIEDLVRTLILQWRAITCLFQNDYIDMGMTEEEFEDKVKNGRKILKLYLPEPEKEEQALP